MINLTQNTLKEILNYDPDTGIMTWKIQGKGKPYKIGDEAGCKNGLHNGKPYVEIRIFYKLYKAHRLAWLYMTGEWPMEIDHIDGNGLNNKLENLREITHIENMRNKRKMSTNTSGVTGVYWRKQRNKWRALITVQ